MPEHSTGGKKLTLLFLTSPERGQSHVHHAVIHSLATRFPTEVDLHIASYEDLQGGSASDATVHEIQGESIVKFLVEEKQGYITSKRSDFAYTRCWSKTGFWGYLSYLPRVSTILARNGPVAVLSAKDVERVVLDVDPDLIVADSLFGPAHDAANRLHRPYVVLSPNTLKDTTLPEQGLGAFSWPVMGTGYAYPLSWYCWLTNALAMLLTPLVLFTFSSHLRATNRLRNEAGYPGTVVMLEPRKAPLICMTLPELDYPGFIPADVLCPGPILLPQRRFEDQDPETFHWVQQRPTILVALGSHLPLTATAAHTLLEAFKLVLTRRPHLQVLWKLRKFDSDYPIEPDDERIRITPWLKADPVSILPHVKCVVNHGGSNSYHEALSAGVPQVILSPWIDCHDFGVRTEWLGVGKWGNKHAAPTVARQEVFKALLDVVGATADDPKAAGIAARAKEISEVIHGQREAKGSKSGPRVGEFVAGRVKPPGRDVAADWILEHARAAAT